MNPRPSVHAIEAEQALLGALLSIPEALGKIETLQVEEIAEPVHGRILQAIRTRKALGQPVSSVLLADAFRDDPALEDLGGADYLQRLEAIGCYLHDIEPCVDRIKETARRRRLIDLADQIIEDAVDPHSYASTAELLGSRWRELQDLSASSTKLKLRSLREIAADVVGKIGTPNKGWSTLLPALDRGLGGCMPRPGVVGFIARQGVGKSLTLQTLATAAASQGLRTVYYALEMGEEKIGERALARAGDFKSGMFRHGDERLRERASMALEKIPDNLWIADKAGIKFSELRGEAYQLAVKHHIDVFVLDYVQLVNPDKVTDQRAQFLDGVCQWLHEFAKGHDVTVITAAQQNRQGFVRESDGLMNAADNIFAINKIDKPWYHPKLGEVDQVWLEVLKARNGGCDVGSEDRPVLALNPHGPWLWQTIDD